MGGPDVSNGAGAGLSLADVTMIEDGDEADVKCFGLFLVV